MRVEIDFGNGLVDYISINAMDIDKVLRVISYSGGPPWRNGRRGKLPPSYPPKGVQVQILSAAPHRTLSKEHHMSPRNKEMKARFLRERDALLRQKEALENQIAGLELAISLIDDDAGIKQKPGKRVATKGVVLDLLRDVGTRGLNAQNAVDLANQRGITLDRASVSSLLSRLKKDDVVVFDNEVYRLKEFAPRQPAAVVHEWPKQASVFK